MLAFMLTDVKLILPWIFRSESSLALLSFPLKWPLIADLFRGVLALPNIQVMGFLDSIAGIMQIFAATYLPGSLLVLLVQSAIPISMFLSRVILKEKYHGTQYAAAIIVCCGILLVLLPSLTSSDDGDGAATALWGGVLIASCVPMCLSSIYKEIALGDTDLDPV